MVEMIFRVIDNVADNGIIYSSFLISVISTKCFKNFKFLFPTQRFSKDVETYLVCDTNIRSNNKALNE